MKQRLGENKHKLCETIAGRTYCVCYTSGHYRHGVAECWYGEGETVYDADYVDYVKGTVVPKIREGQRATVLV